MKEDTSLAFLVYFPCRTVLMLCKRLWGNLSLSMIWKCQTWVGALRLSSQPSVPDRPACQLQEELVPGLSQYLLYQYWGNATWESICPEVSLVILISVMFGNHWSSLLHFTVHKTEAQREIYLPKITLPGSQVSWLSLELSCINPHSSESPTTHRNREGGDQPTAR